MQDLTPLAATLAAEAGIGTIERIERVAAGANANYVVTAEAGARAVLRAYRELPEPHTAQARLRREWWALETLRAAGAPVAGVVAANDAPGAEALLLEFAEGELLGNIATRLPAARAERAWTAAGAALATVHAIDASRAVATGCEEAGIRAPGSSRGPITRPRHSRMCGLSSARVPTFPHSNR